VILSSCALTVTNGMRGREDSSSWPHRLRQPTPQDVIEKIERLRRQRWNRQADRGRGRPLAATVSRVLRRLGLNKLRALEVEPVRSYERENPGEPSISISRSSAGSVPWAIGAQVDKCCLICAHNLNGATALSLRRVKTTGVASKGWGWLLNVGATYQPGLAIPSGIPGVPLPSSRNR